MTSQNHTEKAPNTLTAPKDDAAAKAAEPSAMKAELTDDEIRAIAGGSSGGDRPSDQ
jgi:hypothetical protein